MTSRNPNPSTPHHRAPSAIAAVALAAILVVGCATDSTAVDADATTGATAGATDDSDAAGTGDIGASALFDSTTVHDISIGIEQDAYEAMVQAYATTGDKEWIEGTVTIDGSTFERVGLRLKGNSSLRGLVGGDGGGPAGSASSDDPQSLPWLVSLDRFVDGQEYGGVSSFVVRANTSETALNEAVALELLGAAGLATQDATPVRFTVNGGDPVLRLVVENPDEVWEGDNFEGRGILYKAESTGDYSYRGDDPAAYEEVFDQETGATEDLTPLIEFLDFINNSDDEAFSAELEDHLDVEAFATYLAVQELIDNQDDIDGPGNNSYLRYDTGTGTFTVVAWDHNLAFGGLGGGRLGGIGGGFGGIEGGFGDPPAEPPGDFPGRPPGGVAGDAPGDGVVPDDRSGGGPIGRQNVLVERFLADPDFDALYEAELERLSDALYASGQADQILEQWVGVLSDQATDLVDAATIAEEAEAIGSYFTGG